MGSYLITGGAGFIGSNIAATMAERRPQDDIVVADYLGEHEKWRNLKGSPPDEVISPNEIFFWLESHQHEVLGVIHMGAISATTQTNADLALEVNVSLPKLLRNWCAQYDTPFIYASSASVYGNGEHGFTDDNRAAAMHQLDPLNTYAWSKYALDYHFLRSAERGRPQPASWAGLRFFNVYGPNEYHKEDQQSVVAKIFAQAQAGEAVQLFKSHHPDYADGGQLRDFLYVKDCVEVVLWLLENPQVTGIYNVGTGHARSFTDLAAAVFHACGRPSQIAYVDMPADIQPHYQYFTQADIGRLRAAGYDRPFTSLEEGVHDYVTQYLNAADPYR